METSSASDYSESSKKRKHVALSAPSSASPTALVASASSSASQSLLTSLLIPFSNFAQTVTNSLLNNSNAPPFSPRNSVSIYKPNSPTVHLTNPNAAPKLKFASIPESSEPDKQNTDNIPQLSRPIPLSVLSDKEQNKKRIIETVEAEYAGPTTPPKLHIPRSLVSTNSSRLNVKLNPGGPSRVTRLSGISIADSGSVQEGEFESYVQQVSAGMLAEFVTCSFSYANLLIFACFISS